MAMKVPVHLQNTLDSGQHDISQCSSYEFDQQEALG